MALDINFKCLDDANARRTRCLNNSGGDLKEGDIVYFNSGTLTEGGDSQTTQVCGILCADIDNGDVGEMYIQGLFQVNQASSINFALGSEVYLASASTVDLGTAGDISIGVSIEDPASGASTLDFELRTVFTTSTTHA